jgi:hypothetical protein
MSKQIFYYAIAYDGIEVNLGTTDRGYTRRYASIRTLRQYFLDAYIRGIYDRMVKESDMRDAVIHVYRVSELNSHLSYNNKTLVYSERI